MKIFGTFRKSTYFFFQFYNETFQVWNRVLWVQPSCISFIYYFEDYKKSHLLEYISGDSEYVSFDDSVRKYYLFLFKD